MQSLKTSRRVTNSAGVIINDNNGSVSLRENTVSVTVSWQIDYLHLCLTCEKRLLRSSQLQISHPHNCFSLILKNSSNDSVGTCELWLHDTSLSLSEKLLENKRTQRVQQSYVTFTTVTTCSQKEAGGIASCLGSVTRLVTLAREQTPGRGRGNRSSGWNTNWRWGAAGKAGGGSTAD